MQEAFLQAFAGLGQLRDPDRFGAWLAGIVRNVHRAAGRRDPLMLLAEWPEELHPASAQGVPSADDLDRAEALRSAVADLPAGQRQAVELYYYADRPVGQIDPVARRGQGQPAQGPAPPAGAPHRPPPRSHPRALPEDHHDQRPHRPRRAPPRRAAGWLERSPARPRRPSRRAGHRAMGLWLRSDEGRDLLRVRHRPGRGTEPPGPAADPPADGLPARGSGPEDLAVRLPSAAGGPRPGWTLTSSGLACSRRTSASPARPGPGRVTARLGGRRT